MKTKDLKNLTSVFEELDNLYEDANSDAIAAFGGLVNYIYYTLGTDAAEFKKVVGYAPTAGSIWRNARRDGLANALKDLADDISKYEEKAEDLSKLDPFGEIEANLDAEVEKDLETLTSSQADLDMATVIGK